MCGIVGYFGAAQLDLTKAASTILHRGPDMQNITAGRNWKVAFNRLAIFDLSANAMQPFAHDGVTVFLNGEIYNYVELRAEHANEFTCHTHCDVEIVPFLFRKYGVNFLNKLNGAFAVVIIDEATGTNYLVRDRYGKRPLYYTNQDGCLFFASETKALRPLVALKPDKTNLAVNLTSSILIQPLSLYEEVFLVNPGAYIQYNANGHRECRWYQPNITVRPQSFHEVEEKFIALYKDSIRLRHRGDVPVGIFLSGGLDSTSIAHFSHQQPMADFHLITASIEGKAEWESVTTDTLIRDRFCGELGRKRIDVKINFDFWNRSIVRIVEGQESLFVNNGNLVFHALAQAANAAGVKVALSGLGGDELFGGYPWSSYARWFPPAIMRQFLFRNSGDFANEIYTALARLNNRITGNKAATFFRLVAQAQVWHAQSISSQFAPYLLHESRDITGRIHQYSREYFRWARTAVKDDVLNQFNLAFIFTVLGHQIEASELPAAKYAIDGRSPLLDYRLMEYMMSVPDQMKIKEGQKGLFRQILSKYLPPYITDAPKSGPTPNQHQWLQDDKFRREVKGFLWRNRHLISELLSPQVAQLVAQDYIYQAKYKTMMVFSLISFVLWAKLHVENSIADTSITFRELATS